MSPIHRVALLPMLVFASLAAADPCSEVVADTVAEIRAGATDRWSADVENLVRAAAGSACVKARSGRYGVLAPASGSGAEQKMAVRDPATRSAADPAPDTEADDGKDAGADSDKGGFSLGGFIVRGQSGSPTKKPYERTREDRDGGA